MNIQIDENLGLKIKAIAEQQGKSENELIQEMISSYLASYFSESTTPSCYDLALKIGFISPIVASSASCRQSRDQCRA